MRAHRLPLAVLALFSGGLLAAYFVYSPAPWLEFDSQNTYGTPTYVGAAKDILSGHVFSAGRMPGYPLLLAALGGTNDFFTAVVLVQSLLFVAAVILAYAVAWRAFHMRWIALVIALMLATDVYAAAYAKEILSETLALVLLAGLIVVLASFTMRPRPSMVWVVAALATATTFTRPEWMFLPLALALYFAVWAIRRPLPRQVMVHGLVAVAACYAVVGLYIAGNTAFNGYAGTSEINNVSVLGKVMEYNMQLEAPGQFRAEAQVVDQYVNVKHLNVWRLVTQNPPFAANHYQLSGAFGRAVILADPLRYARLSLKVTFTKNAVVDKPLLHLADPGQFRLELMRLADFTVARYSFYWLLPAFALIWLFFPLISRRQSSLDILGPIAAVVTYGALIIGFGGFDEYGRYHTVYLPASNLLVWGTLLYNVELAVRAKGYLRPLVLALLLLEILLVVVLAVTKGFALSVAITLAVALAQAVVVWWALRGEPLAELRPRAQPAPRTQC